MSAGMSEPEAEVHGRAHAVERAEAGPNLTVYVLTAIATFAVTAIELLIINAEGARPLLWPLMGINFGLAALFYQGLWYEKVEYKVIFGTGVLLGVLVIAALAAMLPLGLNVR